MVMLANSGSPFGLHVCSPSISPFIRVCVCLHDGPSECSAEPQNSYNSELKM